MLILTLRTDKPESKISLYEDNKQIIHEKWEAHRKLAETIHLKIKKILESQKLDWAELRGVVVYKGPGSFTGLRIGLSTANALAYGLKVPIVASSGNDWKAAGIERIQQGINETIAMPDYGSPVHVTLPKK